jgi:fatty-acyl-CoA synthase
LQAPTLLVTTPVTHTAAPMVDATLASGGSVVLQPAFEAGAVLDAVNRHGVSWAMFATAHLYRLAEALVDRGVAPIPTLRHIVYGGSPASAGALIRTLAVFGPILRQSYGTTETWGITALTPQEHLDPALLRTVGRPLPGVEVTLRDPAGSAVPIGDAGEVCVRSPLSMDRYWHDPDATAEVMRSGWVHTGDLGVFDDAGYLTLVGRIDEAVKVAGVRVQPGPIEEALLARPDVVEAAVLSVPDRAGAERISVAVVLRREADTPPADLAQTVVAAVRPYDLEISVSLVDTLPLTPTGKPDKARLRAELQET